MLLSVCLSDETETLLVQLHLCQQHSMILKQGINNAKQRTRITGRGHRKKTKQDTNDNVCCSCATYLARTDSTTVRTRRGQEEEAG